mmetsp:Transcript_8969/g.10422  ORF Transcript_8969/g.10422 Transcript_8969/m.10422 type:complete len:81 (+) Transcript_8969:282-524(+)
MGGDIAYMLKNHGKYYSKTAMELLPTKPGFCLFPVICIPGLVVTIESVCDCAKGHNLQWISPEETEGKNEGDGVYVFSRI